MPIRSTGAVEFNRTDLRPTENYSARNGDDGIDQAPVVNLQAELNDAAEEMAYLLSTFGRFNRIGRKNDGVENDAQPAILEDNADKKLELLIKQVAKLRDFNQLLNYARSLFPNDSDLMLALRELLHSRQVSEQLKKEIKNAMAELQKFGDNQKMQSGINVSRVAVRFSEGNGDKQLSAQSLRNSYLRFLELDLPPCFIYQDWIDQYGSHNRKRLLAFTLAAIIADMKANEPGIHFDEFGPLCAKLSEARALHTLDMTLNENFAAFEFRESLRNGQLMLEEENIVGLYMTGLVDFNNLDIAIQTFSHDYMSELPIKERARVMQALSNVYSMTPASLFADETFRDIVRNFMASLMLSLSVKERNSGIWKEHYK